MVHGWGESSSVVNKLPTGCREGLQAEALTSGGLLKVCWALQAPSRA